VAVSSCQAPPASAPASDSVEASGVRTAEPSISLADESNAAESNEADDSGAGGPAGVGESKHDGDDAAAAASSSSSSSSMVSLPSVPAVEMGSFLADGDANVVEEVERGGGK